MHIHNFLFVRTLDIAHKRSEQKSLSDSLSALNPAQFPLRCLFELYRELEIFTSCVPEQESKLVLAAERMEEKYHAKLISRQELQMQPITVKQCLKL